MPNRHGTPIWYEYMSRDPKVAKAFYDAVVGWTIDAEPVAGGSGMDYRMIAAADGPVGGVFRLSEAMCSQGARPCWLMYVGVDDVDACVAQVTAAGGQALMPAFDIPDVGRIAMLTDPQGAMFYAMRGLSPEESHAYAPERVGHGAWHELHTTDLPAAAAFYEARFGWVEHETMDMGPMGPYRLFGHGGQHLGGMMKNEQVPMPAWLVYFRVDSIRAAEQRIRGAGGQVLNGPMEVPGGGWIVTGQDPEGAMFALTGPA